MPQVFVTSSDISKGLCVITGDDFHHLVRVRRVKVNDIIDLRDESGTLLKARVTNLGASFLEAEVVDRQAPESEPVTVNLCISLLKGKKFDFVVQKAVEIGVRSITPVISKRSVPDVEDKESRKLERWSRIAAEAAKQCMRREVPRLHDIIYFEECVLRKPAGLRVIAHPGSSAGCKGLLEPLKGETTVNLLVGPEGGFSPGEISLALDNGWSAVNFGFTSLRAETAAIVLPSIIIYEWGL